MILTLRYRSVLAGTGSRIGQSCQNIITDIINCIPSFSGNIKDFKAFINSCDFAICIANESQIPLVIKYIKDRLGNHGTILDSLNEWNGIKVHLEKIIGPPSNKKEIELDILTLQQLPNESVISYKKRSDELLEKITYFKTTDEPYFTYLSHKLKDNFVDGFSTELRIIIKAEKPESTVWDWQEWRLIIIERRAEREEDGVEWARATNASSKSENKK